MALDWLDIAYLHDPDDRWEAASTTGIGALIELRDQGVVRAIGAAMNQSAMLAAFVATCDVDVVMLAGRCTLIDRHAEEDLLPLALERGVAVVAAGVYNSGLLSRREIAPDAQFEYDAAPPTSWRSPARWLGCVRCVAWSFPRLRSSFQLATLRSRASSSARETGRKSNSRSRGHRARSRHSCGATLTRS